MAFQEPPGDRSDPFTWADPWAEVPTPTPRPAADADAAAGAAESSQPAGGSAAQEQPAAAAAPRVRERRRRIFGRDAVSLPPGEEQHFAVCWPMRGGRLDVRRDQPVQRVLDAMEARPRTPSKRSPCLQIPAALRRCQHPPSSSSGVSVLTFLLVFLRPRISGGGPRRRRRPPSRPQS